MTSGLDKEDECRQRSLIIWGQKHFKTLLQMEVISEGIGYVGDSGQS